MVFHDRLSDCQMRCRIGAKLFQFRFRPRDLLVQRSLGSAKSPALRTADGSGSEIELQRLVPELLLRGFEGEWLPTLNAATVFVHVEILRVMVPWAEHLL